MKLTFDFCPTFSPLQTSIAEELSFHTTKLYNIANYECRENGVKNYYQLEKMFKANWHSLFLHSHSYQHCLKLLEQNWKSFFKASSDFTKNPSKYFGKPNQPKFKNCDKRKNEVVFTNLAVRFQNSVLKLSLSKEMRSKFNVNSLDFEVSKKLQSIVNWNHIQQVRLSWDNSTRQWHMFVIYNQYEAKKSKNSNVMSIDLGLDNLATLTFKDNIKSFIIDGKRLKSVNSHMNKRIARLTSIVMKQCKNPKLFKRTQQIQAIQTYRNNFIRNYLHKTSHRIIKIAVKNQVGTILIGNIKGIKHESKIKNFVQIPLQKLVKKIEYKAKLAGIKVVLVNEAYTSGCSSLDLEPLIKKFYNKNRRIKRGLFVTSFGLINSDVNGSLNIMRRYLKEGIPKQILVARDKGVVTHPKRIRVA